MAAGGFLIDRIYQKTGKQLFSQGGSGHLSDRGCSLRRNERKF